MRERATRTLGEGQWVATLDELLGLSIDAAIVTSPDDTHEDITCSLLEAGVAVFLEKPIAITIEGADRVLETAYRTRTPLYVGTTCATWTWCARCAASSRRAASAR